MGNDVLPNEDEFYFNVIGTGFGDYHFQCIIFH